MSRLDDIVESLRHADRYPHAVEGAVHVVQTHISVVLLTGPYAYKIKKPVDLGFLDYSTLEKREEGFVPVRRLRVVTKRMEV